MTRMTRRRTRSKGMSLIELMIAILIGSFLLLGLVEVFAASRTAYQLSEGLARVQENSRFAIDYLQRDLRMAGHFGCVNDQSHLQNPDELHSHFDTVDGPLLFNVSVQGYEADGTKPGDTADMSAAAGTWNPALPQYLKDLNVSPGSDIVVLRYLSGEGVPVTSFVAAPGNTTIQVSPGQFNTLTRDGVANPTLFGIADCKAVDIFQASVTPATGTLTVALSGLNKFDFLSDKYTASPAGEAMVYRAEAMVYFVRPSAAGGGQRSLWRVRYNSAGGALTSNPEELVEGIESLQLLYGLDRAANAATPGQPTGYIETQTTADKVDAAKWRYVGLIRVGILAKSPNRAAAGGPGADLNKRPNALGVSFAPPNPYDGNYRTTYESTIAVRNRLYGN